MQFISHFTSLNAWQCVKASRSSTEDQVTVCRWLASFILVRTHPTHQTNSDNIHLPVCCVYAVLTVLTVFSARTCSLHYLCLSHTSTHWLTLTISSTISLLTTLSCLSLWTQSTQPRSSVVYLSVQLPAVRHWLLCNNLLLNQNLKWWPQAQPSISSLLLCWAPWTLTSIFFYWLRRESHWVSPSAFSLAVVLHLLHCSSFFCFTTHIRLVILTLHDIVNM